MIPEDELHRRIIGYFEQKLREHGATARGADWNSEASQVLRFRQLLRIVENGSPFSVTDFGCGYGALAGHLLNLDVGFEYFGLDISGEMIAAAEARHRGHPSVSFSVGSVPDRSRDYCVASGIFNIKLDTPDHEWLPHILHTLDLMHEYSANGFAFNALTTYSDADRMRSDLYYADPLRIFDHCKRRYSRNVALLHDYGLYEFTVLVRKNSG